MKKGLQLSASIYIMGHGQIIHILFGALAQLGERRAGSAKVTGSSPVCSIHTTLAQQGFLFSFWEMAMRYPSESPSNAGD